MTNNVAVFIDGAFYTKKYTKTHSIFPNSSDVSNEVNLLVQHINKTRKFNKLNLLRVYYYDCYPFDKKVKNFDGTKEIDFSLSKMYNPKKKFLDDLKLQNQFAVRLGNLSFNGWILNQYKKPSEYIPDFKQKSVDMKIGLDMAWVSLKGKVDAIILIAGDSDFISPMKWVRKEGILVYLYLKGHTHINKELKEHADFIIDDSIHITKSRK